MGTAATAAGQPVEMQEVSRSITLHPGQRRRGATLMLPANLGYRLLNLFFDNGPNRIELVHMFEGLTPADDKSFGGATSSGPALPDSAAGGREAQRKEMTMARKLQILILEDRPAEAELVMRELRKEGIQFEGKRVATKADFLAQLRDFAPDIILAAYSIPSYDGLSGNGSTHSMDRKFVFGS